MYMYMTCQDLNLQPCTIRVHKSNTDQFEKRTKIYTELVKNPKNNQVILSAYKYHLQIITAHLIEENS